jgi:hypothetical protein
MEKLNPAAVAYIIAALFTASIAALTPVANVVARNNTADTNTTTGVGNSTQAQGSTHRFLQSSLEN